MGERKKLTADRRKEELKSVAFAKLNNVPTSPRKMRLVADMVRGKEVFRALGILKFSNKEYSFSQDSTGGREFLGDFYPCDSGEAEINLTFSTGGVKDSAGNWNWTDVENREYEYEIQFLDPEYNGENPEDHIVFSLSQKYGAKAQEVQYAAKNSEKTYVKNNDNLIGTIDKNGITSRSTTTWNISVKFNFDKNTVCFKLLNSDNSGGYVYENIPTYGGFKTLRFVSKGNNKVQWTPKISNLVYSKFAFEPSPVDPKTIKVDGKGALSVSFDKAYDGGAPTSYKVTLTDTDGKCCTKKHPILFPLCLMKPCPENI